MMPRNFKQEYANYDGTPAVKKKRAARNKARRMLEQREGKLVAQG
jgi:flagellar biosynthesis protein FlhB